MSNMFDVAGTDESMGKEHTPKETNVCSLLLGHTFKRCMTVIDKMGRYQRVEV